MAQNKKNSRNADDTTGSNTLRIVVDHDMGGQQVYELEKRFLAEMNGIKNRKVALDLKIVKRIDSKGIALCIGLFKECQARGCSLVIEAGPELYRFFKVLKLTKVIDIREVAAV
jgi:anti-anti-sigma factor